MEKIICDISINVQVSIINLQFTTSTQVKSHSIDTSLNIRAGQHEQG